MVFDNYKVSRSRVQKFIIIVQNHSFFFFFRN